jgi:hypothetical protein
VPLAVSFLPRRQNVGGGKENTSHGTNEYCRYPRSAAELDALNGVLLSDTIRVAQTAHVWISFAGNARWIFTSVVARCNRNTLPVGAHVSQQPEFSHQLAHPQLSLVDLGKFRRDGKTLADCG